MIKSKTGQAKLLDAAETLFFSNGYESTTVKEIVDLSQTSQAIFEEHFSSKEEIMEAVVYRLVSYEVKVIQQAIHQSGANAVSKWNQVMFSIHSWRTKHKEEWIHVFKQLNKSDNALMKQRIDDAIVESYAPLFTKIIKQGVDTGVFHPTFGVSGYENMSEIILFMLLSVNDKVSNILIASETYKDPFLLIKSRLDATETLIERTLGVAQGTLVLYDHSKFMGLKV